MAENNGGLERAADWSQFYFVPGMGHCQGGSSTLDQFDMLSKLVAWVENDEQPTEIIAKGESMPNISRPLCPYPQVAQYHGDSENKGDIEKDIKSANLFQCRALD
ncbi:tannase/feruloyl esterase family alpha/beta hydrolase [Halioxenophilus aromaticivorans]|uniref:Carboxylic ester hydrolase n=1 Tax=Halioxenophilus aromaticivorans TaxID=1306992 RepID=A0AAV3TXH2_9ALTE